MRVSLVLVWVAAVLIVAWIALTTHLGPVYGLGRGHGVHLGEIVAAVVLFGSAAAVTAMVRRGHSR